jgi:serine/threonine-protein kinase
MARLGRYEIIEEIGRGAMGVVYRARDPVIDRTVALKAINATGSGETESFHLRFRQEAQAAGRLSHPGIVTIFDVGEQEDTRTPYIVMEFVAGRTLSAAVNDASPPLSRDDRLDLIQQVAEALDCAHKEGIVHRDIKPANILVTREGRAKIADFGVAKLRLTQSQMTVVGGVLGTPSFMSPEQVEGKPADGRSDLFSLGVILYWIITGRMPFDGDSPGEILFKIVSKEPTPPSVIHPALSPEFDRVLARALAKNPDDRYPTGQALRDDIEALRQERAGRVEAGSQVPATTASGALAPTERIATAPAVRSAAEKTVILPPPTAVSTSPGQSIAKADVGPVAEFAKIVVQKTLALLLLLLGLAVDFAATLPRRMREAAAGVHRAWKWTRSLRPLQQAGVITVAVVLVVGIGVSLGLSMFDTATLKIALSGDLMAGKVSVWMDDRQIANGAVESRTVKLAGILPRTEGNYYRELRVPPGIHTIRVRVVGTKDPYDETRQIAATLRQDASYTMYVRCGSRWESNTMTLKLYWVGAGVAFQPS